MTFDLITHAREFLKSHLEANSTNLHESSAVQAMVSYLQQHGNTETVSPTESDEYKKLQQNLADLQTKHETSLAESESTLQKANAKIEDLQKQIDELLKPKSAPVETPVSGSL